MRRPAVLLAFALLALVAPAAGARAPVEIRRDAPAPGPVKDIEYGTANGKRLLQEGPPYMEAAFGVTVLGATGALLLRRRHSAPRAARALRPPARP